MAASKSKIEIILSAKDTGLTAAMTRAKAQVSAFSASISSASAPFRALISSALSLKSALAGVVAGAGVTALSASLIKAGQSMDSLRLSYQAISGSSAGAAQEMEFVRTTADKLGLDLMTTAQAYKQLSGAAMGTSLAGKQTRDIFVAVAKASTTLGLSADETSGALLAIGQMISKGKVSAEELRGQLAERLPGAFQIAAQAMGVTTAELDKMMSNGEVMTTDFIPRFAAALEQRFGQGAAAAANSFTAASNRISSGIDTLKAGLGSAVTNNNFFVTAMNGAANTLQSLSTDVAGNGAKWREWAKQVGLSAIDFGVSTIKAASSAYSALEGLAGGLQKVAAGYYAVKAGALEWSAFITVEKYGAAQFARDADEASKKSDEFSAAAKKSFAEMEAGSPKLLGAAEALSQYREKMAQVSSTEVIGTQAQKTADEVVKIGDKYINVTRRIDEANQAAGQQTVNTWDGVWKQVESGALDDIGTIEKALQELTKDRTVTVTVRQVEGRQLGGLIGAYRNGGMLMQRLATGGSVRNILSGGSLSGYGGGDRRLLLGEDGEFMIRKEAVRRFGAHVFHALNNLQLPRFALGGQVGAVAAGAGEAMNINLNFPGGGSVPVTATPAMARELLRQFERMGWRASA